MVRLVFRPYTHVRRTICTSVSLRASIRVSPDFTLHKHSSPSFGSQHICSCAARCSNTSSACSANILLQYRLPFASGFVTHTLAHMLDSLVRVSRRVGLRRFTERARFMVSGAAAHRYELRQTTFHVLREGHRNKTDHNSLIRLL